jgi:hypothetical protein
VVVVDTVVVTGRVVVAVDVVDVVVVVAVDVVDVEVGDRVVVLDVVVVVVAVVVVVEVVVEVVVVVAPTVGITVVEGDVPVDGPPPDRGAPSGPRLVVGLVGVADEVDVARSVGGGVTTRPATDTEDSATRRVVVVEVAALRVDESAARSPASFALPSSRRATATVPPARTSAAIGNAAFAHVGHRSYACAHRADAGSGARTATVGGYSKLRGTPSGPTDHPCGNCSGGYQASPERHQPGPGAPSAVMLSLPNRCARQRRCRGSSNRGYRAPHSRNWAARPMARPDSGHAEEVAAHVARQVIGHRLRLESPDAVDRA